MTKITGNQSIGSNKPENYVTLSLISITKSVNPLVARINTFEIQIYNCV
jgi:hypothetical protein